MDPDGENVVRFTEDPGIESEPVAFPDGGKVIFTHDIDFSNPQIYIANFSDTMTTSSANWTKLTSVGANRYPALRLRQ